MALTSVVEGFRHALDASFQNSTELYLKSGVDISSLNFLEQLWATWYIALGNPFIATGVLSFLLHEFMYFGRCVPWWIISKIPSFQKYKIQDEKIPSYDEQWACTVRVLIIHFTIELPLIMLFHPIAEVMGLTTWQLPFPPLKQIALQVAFFFFFEDTYHYFAHQALHTKALYKHIHKIHHKHSAPFGLAAEYAHPLEVIILGIGTIGGPWVYVGATGDLHMIAVYLWISLRLLQVIDAHSGYDFPWSLHNIIPFWGGADFHDYHHMAFINNYSSSFRHWDWLFGTDRSYSLWKAKKDQTPKPNVNSNVLKTS
ncbi:C-4 methyl sterol oxidase [Sistotremastrum niveocremeum HHB9708]|uniref:C-4 methyl sterol oxidase n=1 Tax=Sistotremastrum niveocremeum HHB9708 TaxID=1314777 RepID=A0A164VM45_9AGAM|nr:C-4 methyl sterol oxidase [Sistotremastrum niveocremeum HHB9708]